MQVNICLTAKLYSLCRYCGLVVSAVLALYVRSTHEGSNPGKDQPEPYAGIVPECRQWRVAKPGPRRWLSNGQRIARPWQLAPVAGISVGPHGAGAPAPPAADGHPAMLLPPAPRQGIRTSPLHSSGNRETRTRR